MKRNKHYGIIYSFDEWVSIISKLTNDLDKDYEKYGLKNPIIPIFHPVFRNCKMFMNSPVCLFNNDTIIGRSKRFDNFDEIKSYLDENEAIPYYLYSLNDYYVFRHHRIEK